MAAGISTGSQALCSSLQEKFVEQELMQRTGLSSAQPRAAMAGRRRYLVVWRVRAEGAETAEEKAVEIRVCTHKTCRKEGALQALDLFRGLAPPTVTVETCGCLGRCGAGPNAVMLPSELFVSHCNTPAHVARLLDIQCGAAEPENNLKALSFKNAGNEHFGRGDIRTAEALFTQAIELNPSGGIHNLYVNRSAARLAQGNALGALEDAQQAAEVRPGWSQAYVRQAEAHGAAGNVQAALDMYGYAAEIDGELRRSKQFQRKVKELQAKLAPVISNQ